MRDGGETMLAGVDGCAMETLGPINMEVDDMVAINTTVGGTSYRYKVLNVESSDYDFNMFSDEDLYTTMIKLAMILAHSNIEMVSCKLHFPFHLEHT